MNPTLESRRTGGGFDTLIHAALGVAALLTVLNFFSALERVAERSPQIAEALFRPENRAFAVTATPTNSGIVTNLDLTKRAVTRDATTGPASRPAERVKS